MACCGKRLRLIATPTELLHLIRYIPRVEVLRPSTLGWENATPTELPLLTGGPSPAIPKGRESIGAPPHPSPRGGSPYLLCFRRFEWLLPLGEGWDGASMLATKIPLPSFPFLGNRRGTCRCLLSPLGENWRGAFGSWRGAFSASP